jgi:hypothetical protein
MLGVRPIGTAPLSTSATFSGGVAAGAAFDAEVHHALPAIILKATVVDLGGKTDNGRIVRAVLDPWFDILEVILRDPTIATRWTGANGRR